MQGLFLVVFVFVLMRLLWYQVRTWEQEVSFRNIGHFSVGRHDVHRPQVWVVVVVVHVELVNLFAVVCVVTVDYVFDVVVPGEYVDSDVLLMNHLIGSEDMEAYNVCFVADEASFDDLCFVGLLELLDRGCDGAAKSAGGFAVDDGCKFHYWVLSMRLGRRHRVGTDLFRGLGRALASSSSHEVAHPLSKQPRTQSLQKCHFQLHR